MMRYDKVLLWLIPALFFILLATGVSAEQFNSYCFNESLRVVSYEFIYNTDVKSISYNETCQFGCVNGECFSEFNIPPESYAGIILVIVIIAFIFAYLSTQLDRNKHGVLQIFFLLLTMLFIFTDVFIIFKFMGVVSRTAMSEIMETVFMVTFWVFFLVLLYILIYIFYTVIMGIVKRRRSRYDED